MADDRSKMSDEERRSRVEIEAAYVRKEEKTRSEAPEVESPRSKSGWIGSSTE